MHQLLFGDGCLGFAVNPVIASTSTAATANQPGKFQSVIGLIQGGLDTYRQQRGLNPIYSQPAPPPITQLPPGAGPEGQNPGGSSGLFSFDNQGLHIGDATLSPTMLLLIGAAIFLYLREPPRRGGR